MESPGHLNGNSKITAAYPASDASQNNTPQNPTDTVGILKQQLIKIARGKHEKLTKDVGKVLQGYSTGMESDLIYIINEYTSTKSELDDAAKEISQLKAANAVLTEQLRVATGTAQHVQPGSDNLVQDKTQVDNLQLELNITTKELYRALEDVAKLKAQQLQMEVSIEDKDVVNQQLAAVVSNRQADITLKQKENTELARKLTEVQTQLSNTMNFVHQYYSVLEPEIKRRAMVTVSHDFVNSTATNSSTPSYAERFCLPGPPCLCILAFKHSIGDCPTSIWPVDSPNRSSFVFKSPNGDCQPYSNHLAVNNFADRHQWSFDRSLAQAS
ncbi:hypothetical protein BGZ95_000552 [Linnemannia exigua]|uniref:Uncharacterized protein n=1 Tax=Linnemannia exigua TaxID=604196 RepID=A0AAD4HAC8_9FUNG|nr:hypothetical protein BGZ95_000552 [Linnemannia exigua]